MALCEEEAATAEGAGPIHLTLRNHAIVFTLRNDGGRREAEGARRERGREKSQETPFVTLSLSLSLNVVAGSSPM